MMKITKKYKHLPIKRTKFTNKFINKQEFTWWNKNADIISRVWEMHDDISWKVRKGYLNEAKKFFSNENKKVKILELGCGSGWVGQSIADPNLQINGTDFSKKQIQLAKTNAVQRKLDRYCKYTVSNSLHLPSEPQFINGILIHAFLHHLDGNEIEKLLFHIRNNCKKGTKIWIYEPTSYKSDEGREYKSKKITFIVLRIAGLIHEILTRLFIQFNLIDKKSYDSFCRLMNQAKNNNWYLSPKEIPFDLGEFSKQLEMKFKIVKSYWATVYIIGWVFEINLVTVNSLRYILNKLIVPILIYSDNLVKKDEGYLRHYLTTPNYAFHVWECVI